jgi:hypothetical protein
VEPDPTSGVDTSEWKIGRDGPVKLSYSEKMGEGEKTIMQVGVYKLYYERQIRC